VAQGFLFGRPMAADQLMEVLARNAAEQSEVHGG
jgi:EAL domain-containing protein (putative c-di-GMP-specific phosphodiesterase class I)